MLVYYHRLIARVDGLLNQLRLWLLCGCHVGLKVFLDVLNYLLVYELRVDLRDVSEVVCHWG